MKAQHCFCVHAHKQLFAITLKVKQAENDSRLQRILEMLKKHTFKTPSCQNQALYHRILMSV